MPVTNQTEVLQRIRELSFDRFVTPSFFITTPDKLATWKFEITSTAFIVKDTVTPVTYTYLFADYPTLDSLLQAIITAGIKVDIVYSGAFIGTEPSTSLMPLAERSLELYRPVFRKYYFSDAYIINYFREYASEVFNMSPDRVEAIVWEDELESEDFDFREQEHFIYWVSYYLVQQRRVYELAGEQLQFSTYSGIPGIGDGLQVLNSGSFVYNKNAGETVQVQIGDVFTLSEDPGASIGLYNNGEIPKDMVPPWGIGSDNVLMDYYSFWYRLQLWIRNRFEQKFQDYCLRQSQMMTSKMSLDPRDSVKWAGYFDSYPWVFSPFLRMNGAAGLIGTGRNF